VEQLSQADIVADHLLVALPAHLLDSQPNLQSTEAPGVLRTEIHVVGGFDTEVVVERVVGVVRQQPNRSNAGNLPYLSGSMPSYPCIQSGKTGMVPDFLGPILDPS